MNNRNVAAISTEKEIDELMDSIGASPEMKAAIIGAVQIIAYEAYMNGKTDALNSLSEESK